MNMEVAKSSFKWKFGMQSKLLDSYLCELKWRKKMSGDADP